MKRIHFIGICGISMSALAQILHERGHQVSGSDVKASEMSEHLQSVGIPVAIGQRAENITNDMDLIVYTAAIHEHNPELIAARASGARVIERAVLLGEMMEDYEIPIGIAGTHGKTSTSSMLSYIFMEAGLDPTITVGGILQKLNSNFRIGHSPYFILEACEYCDSFLHFQSKVNVITNIEAEHLDYFGSLENIQKSFRKFVSIMKPNSTLIVGADIAPLFEDYTGTLYTVSLEQPADVTCTNIRHHEHELGSSFDFIMNGKRFGTLDIYVPGRHYIFDALCAAAAAISQGVPFSSVKEGLSAYRSTKKRFEYKGSYNGTLIIDDYAHHPSEMKATLQAADEVPHKELYVVFQPHTYSRTKLLFNDFVEALSHVDHIILADIYSASREQDLKEVHSKDLQRELLALGCDCHYFPDFDEIEKFLLKNISPNDMLITMGAGDVVKIAESILQK